ncbi:MAG: hypothetical protein P8N02_00750 [Actinomycetota bacterium]|nr:hypothetical protein [Actinomycetota bacterium]
MANLLRDEPGTVGLCSANGGYLTKHAFGIYSTNPPDAGFQHVDCQEEIDQAPSTELDDTYVGSGSIEGYTVMHGAEGPEIALAAVTTPNGRQWANSRDAAQLEAMITEEHVGHTVEVAPDFTFHIA